LINWHQGHDPIATGQVVLLQQPHGHNGPMLLARGKYLRMALNMYDEVRKLHYFIHLLLPHP
jgi:hypothetical protein